jgi:hypothetical protein
MLGELGWTGGRLSGKQKMVSPPEEREHLQSISSPFSISSRGMNRRGFVMSGSDSARADAKVLPYI